MGCEYCGKRLNKGNRSGFCSKHHWKSAASKEYSRKYQQSDAGKETTARYWTSEKGRLQAYKELRGTAQKRGISFTLTYTEFRVTTDHPCLYCKGPLPLRGGGLDRIDPRLGYSFDNVFPSCGPCNVLRGLQLSVEEAQVLVSVLKTMRKAKQSPWRGPHNGTFKADR